MSSDFLDLHPVLTDRSRLAIMALLAASKEAVSFNELLERLQLTKGNLSSHLRRLEDSGFIEVSKAFVERKPLTTYRCSTTGRVEMKRYLETVERMLKNVIPKS